MHSKIFQISREHEIKKEDFITELRYGYGGEYEYFVGSVADYVDDVEDREGCIEWFIKTLGVAATYENGKMTLLNKKVYFDSKYETFMKNIKMLQGITLEQFSNDELCLPTTNRMGNEVMHSPDLTVCELSETYDDKYGFYIDDKGEYFGLVTLDYFLRHIKNGDSWYFGNVIDYHF